ncbi:hypothetical protein BDF22DRAFT_674262 [Syncephalis plumigaleata]|nr:hypothetical protein BDF22DRAFT_674262 [Syncephalis plumigaleata]
MLFYLLFVIHHSLLLLTSLSINNPLFTHSTAHSYTILCIPLYSSCSALPVSTLHCNCSYHSSPTIYSPLGLSTRLLLYSYTRISIVYL